MPHTSQLHLCDALFTLSTKTQLCQQPTCNSLSPPPPHPLVINQARYLNPTCSSLKMMASTSSPTYPACVSVVASAMAKGTLTSLASVLASSVLPEPVGPCAGSRTAQGGSSNSSRAGYTVSLTSSKSLDRTCVSAAGQLHGSRVVQTHRARMHTKTHSQRLSPT